MTNIISLVENDNSIKDKTDLSNIKSAPSELPHEKLPEPIQVRVDEVDLTDKRTAPKNGKLIHNWWIQFLKAFKYWNNVLSSDTIVNTTFNLGSKKVEIAKLYENVNKKFPSCSINFNDFKNATNINQRDLIMCAPLNMFEPLIARDEKTGNEIRIGVKEMEVSLSTTLNFDNSTDVLIYHEALNKYPRNCNFIPFEYTSLINIHEETSGWKIDNEVKGLINEVIPTGLLKRSGLNKRDDYIQRWGEYTQEPTFVINSVNKIFEKQQETYQLKIDYTINLNVPQALFQKKSFYGTINAIEIVIDMFDKDIKDIKDKPKSEENEDIEGQTRYILSSLEKPITIDSSKIYDSGKVINQIYLTNKNFDFEKRCIILPKTIKEYTDKHSVALYNVKDTIESKPEINWQRLNYIFTKNEDTNGLPKSNCYYSFDEDDEDIMYLNLSNPEFSKSLWDKAINKFLESIKDEKDWTDIRLIIYE